ncbi:MAG: chaperone NapD [Anaeromyxobacteraceae bacterium]|nr:chaperone NapD [Anaeromyxobacteraceae bacterium]
MSTVAGVVLLTAPGAGPRVAARLVGLPGLTLAGGDGDQRVAAVWEAEDGATLEALSERLLGEDPEVLGVFPTFVGQE